ncbi:protein-export membrane protein SecF [Salinivibrio sp. PR932]|uniref:protein translocase subunit SecF n=1 Tax=Salinivibrio sp. PR932 TaxID=1909492 RepID=UPI000988AE05|nr:protein translocase subunit SecF [Salinivibrio sp. PR932]OOF18577.1 protein-export membrane protein SecF [Salinivibrio sp. PR932]
MKLTQVRYTSFALSGLLTVISLWAIAYYGLNLGIDFTGGIVIDFALPSLAGSDTLIAALHNQFGELATLTPSTTHGQWQLILPHASQWQDPQQVIAQISSALAMPVNLVQANVVGPQVGQVLFEQGGLALLVASLAIMLYLAIRFEWRLALAAVGALVHDVILTLGLLAILAVPMDLNVIAGLLAVIGYSLNDSIVIGDRLRDVLRAKPNQCVYISTNIAVCETFSRTLITAGTTLFTIGCLLVLGGDALYGFALTLFVGVLTGTWSSVAVASCLQEMLGLSPAHYQRAPAPEREGAY